MKQLLLELIPPVPSTFENFVVGRNRELVHQLRAALEPSAAERFIYVWGAPGSGKSHLLEAFAARARTLGQAAVRLGAVGFDEAQVPDDCLLVALDDVESLAGDAAQTALFNVYNDLRERGGALVASGAAAPGQLGLRPELATRLGWGLVYQVHGLTDEEKMEALAGRAREHGWPLPNEVAAYLMRHAARDLSFLLGTVEALDRYSRETKRPITVPLLREILPSAAED
ncbi:MAG: DnaA regulatory inactivator Hda [Betaproteobacteria bacterium]|nr:DnaA regulatory inactivator Hda [Betaproteobacteria bacterium]